MYVIFVKGGESVTFSENARRAKQQIDAVVGCSFVIEEGSGKVMFSAPHCVEQVRGGKAKCAEPQTGLLAQMLHNEFDCPIIRKVENRGDDANFDPVSDYKEALTAYVRENKVAFLIDLHQLSPKREVMINFGTGDFANIDDISLLNVFVSAFSRHKLGTIQLDEPFGATYVHTVSATVHRECQIPCLQIELNSRLLGEGYGEYALETVYAALAECYKELTEMYDRRGTL